jgi:N-methylhydantoinase A
MLASELRYEAMRSHVGDTGSLDADAVRELYRTLEDQARQRLAEWFQGDIKVQRSADMRYGEQIYEIDVALDAIDFTADDLLDHMKQAFEQRHEELYTYSLNQQEPVLINARVAAIGELPVPPAEPVAGNKQPAATTGQRRIYLGEWLQAPVYRFDELAQDQMIGGPALIESDTTTVLLRPGDSARTTAQRWLDIGVS